MRRFVIVGFLAFVGCDQLPPPAPAPAQQGADPAVEQPALIIPLPVDPDRPHPPPPGERELARHRTAP